MSSDQNLEQGEFQGSKRMVTKVIRALSVWGSPRLGPSTEREHDDRENENPEHSSDGRNIPDEGERTDFSSDRRELGNRLGEDDKTGFPLDRRELLPYAKDGDRFTPRRETEAYGKDEFEAAQQSLGELGGGSSSSCIEPLFNHGVMGYPAPYRLPVSSPRLLPPNYASTIGRAHEAERSYYGETEASVRFGRVNVDNITRRETKRQSGRIRDEEYQRRFSSGSPVVIGSPQIPLGGVPWPREEVILAQPCRTQVSGELAASRENAFLYSPVHQQKGGQGVGRQGEDQPYQVTLVCGGQRVTHSVWLSMGIVQLMEDAGSIFGLDPEEVTLLLTGGIPELLRKDSTIQGPPRVTPGSFVMVFSVSRPPTRSIGYNPHAPGYNPYAYQHPTQIPLTNSKLLSTFKLPKFDGMSKSWKTWDRAFQRFLGLYL